MVKESKKPSHVRGVMIGCSNFSMCPICYGCRNYSTHDISCEECAKNKKKNICNTDLHRADLIEKLICKDVVEINESITFMNGGENNG